MQGFGKLSPLEKKENSCTINIPKICSQVAQWVFWYKPYPMSKKSRYFNAHRSCEIELGRFPLKLLSAHFKTMLKERPEVPLLAFVAVFILQNCMGRLKYHISAFLLKCFVYGAAAHGLTSLIMFY